ncbi:hypothetical protein BDQ17DRAFT_825858 [Cyathus striatus]|nr:hypothetical protein BDQ17DRAFT_825858 [Cyathus striatus]
MRSFVVFLSINVMVRYVGTAITGTSKRQLVLSKMYGLDVARSLPCQFTLSVSSVAPVVKSCLHGRPTPVKTRFNKPEGRRLKFPTVSQRVACTERKSATEAKLRRFTNLRRVFTPLS